MVFNFISKVPSPMQRVGSVIKRKEKTEEVTKKVKDAEFTIPNDIAFEICKVYCRDPLTIRSKFQKNINGCFNHRELSFEASFPQLFYHNFNLNVNLKSLRIYNSRCVLLKSFSGMKLEKIEFDSVQDYEICDEKINSLYKLIFKNCCFNPKFFCKVLAFFEPKSLTFINCTLKNTHEQSEYKIYSSILSLKLLNFENINSFISFPNFVRIIDEKQLKKFLYQSEKTIIKYNTIGYSFNYCILQNASFGNMNVLKNSISLIEVLQVDSTQNLLEILLLKPLRIKYLKCENVTFKNEVLAVLQPIHSIVLANCSFENLSFYSFINKNSKTLRFLSLKNIQLPLDGLNYLKKQLFNCQVEINTDKSLFIP